MAVTLLPHFGQVRQNKYALTHNWTLTILPSMLSNPLFAPLLSFFTNIIDGFAGGGVSLNCTSSTVPKSRVKVIRDVIHGQSVQQVAGREPVAGEITLEFLEAHDMRVFKLFEIWMQCLADRFSGNATKIDLPFLKPIEMTIRDGVVLTLYDDNRWQPRTQYNLLDVACTSVSHSDLSSSPGFVTTTVTLAYLNYDLIDIGLIGAANLIKGVDLLGNSSGKKLWEFV